MNEVARALDVKSCTYLCNILVHLLEKDLKKRDSSVMPHVFEREELSKSAPLHLDWLLTIAEERPEVCRPSIEHDADSSIIEKYGVNTRGLSMQVRECLSVALIRLSGIGSLFAGGCLKLCDMECLHRLFCR